MIQPIYQEWEGVDEEEDEEEEREGEGEDGDGGEVGCDAYLVTFKGPGTHSFCQNYKRALPNATRKASFCGSSVP